MSFNVLYITPKIYPSHPIHSPTGCWGQFLHPDSSIGLPRLRASPRPARHALNVAVACHADAAAAAAADAQGMAGLPRDAGAGMGKGL